MMSFNRVVRPSPVAGCGSQSSIAESRLSKGPMSSITTAATFDWNALTRGGISVAALRFLFREQNLSPRNLYLD
jgi:hypothetical protein